MSVYLRLLLMFFAFCSSFYAIRKIRKSQMKIEGAIYWIVLVVIIVLLSIFPGIGITIASWIGIESPANLIYLVMIFMALEKIFSLSVKTSQLEYKISVLAEELAIWRNQTERKGEE